MGWRNWNHLSGVRHPASAHLKLTGLQNPDIIANEPSFKLSRRFLDVWNCFRLMGIKCWQLYTYLKFKLWEMYYLNTSKPYRLQFNTYVFIDLSIFIINMTCGWLYSSAFLSVFAWNMLDIVNNFIDVEWMTTKVGQWDWKDTISMSTMWECKHNF